MTRVRAQVEVEANGLWKLVPPVAAWDLRRKTGVALDRLKQLLEGPALDQVDGGATD